MILPSVFTYYLVLLLFFPFFKMQSLSQFAVELGFLIEEYAGGKGKFPPRKRRKKNVLYICTIEKANMLVRILELKEVKHPAGIIC